VSRWRAGLASLALLLGGCDTPGYYGQAIKGQLQILGQRRDIPALIDSPATSATLRSQLQLVQELRAFAAGELQLPVGRQFSTYVDLQRPYVVWNVFAAPALDLQPLTWCFLVAGCVSYRGYFSESAARDFARHLQDEGYDVYVGGVTAYSTLGWFADPVLNTVIGREPWQLASLLFHELAHQVVYVPGDTAFNESFATAVEQVGLESWLQQHAQAGEASAVLAQASAEQRRRERFVALVESAVADLRELYASGAEREVLLRGKQLRLQQLRNEYEELRERAPEFAVYDAWFSGGLNNAQLATVALYNTQVPQFRRLLRDCSDDLGCFYARVQELSRLDDSARAAALAAP
jgi:predicted aminopeptidase